MFSGGIISHIEALRRMIIEILVIFVLLLIPGWIFAGDVLEFMQKTASAMATQNGLKEFSFSYFALMEPFVAELKTGMAIAFAAGLPFYFWRIWHFLAPALYRREKRVILFGALAAWGLFAAGFALGIFGVMPMLVKFSVSFAREGLTPVIGLNNFIGLAMTVSLAFGAMFELPLLLLLLAAAGIIKLETLRKQRPVVVVVILILAAILTPPDVVSQLMLGVPTYLLFELMLLVGSCWLREKEDNSTEELDEPDIEEAESVQTDDNVSETAESLDDLKYYRRRRVQRRNLSNRSKHKKGYISNG